MNLPVKLIRVVDGDTIQVICRGLKQTVRLNSVDTEESAIGYGKPATATGIRAKHYTREMCQSGELYLGLDEFGSIEEAIPRSRDKYGRLIAHIYIDVGVGGELLHLNRELIQLGFSPYFNKYGSSRLYDSDFREAQQEAQRQDLMIWGESAGGATRNYDKLLPWWERRATALDLARYSSVNSSNSPDSDVNGSKKIWICDNECRLIAEQPACAAKFFPEYLCCLVDFQGGYTARFAKGWVVSAKSEGFLVRLFFSHKFLNNDQNLQLVQQLIAEKDYGFVAGVLRKYRGIPQIEVFSLASTPFDLNLP